MSPALRNPRANSDSATENGRLTGFGSVTPVTAGTTLAISNSSLIAMIAWVSHACAAGSEGKTSSTAAARFDAEMGVPKVNVDPVMLDRYPTASRTGSFVVGGNSRSGGAPIAGSCADVATDDTLKN